MPEKTIPFNWPYMTGKELFYIAESHFNGKLAGDGPFTDRCHAWLQKLTRTKKALLTHSCTAALEMAALLLELNEGDEVIMPSYTFVSTANAFALRRAVPVFIDIRRDTLNIDERLIEEAITPKTKVIVPVHYAGVACEMDTILEIAQRYNLKVVEDAAQGVMATYKGRALGSFGDMGTLSFHETKNVISGEGGALLVNDQSLITQAEIIREKGTNRSQFFRGDVDKYTWQDCGSSFLPGELIAAFLWAQLEEAEQITNNRVACWNLYHEGLEDLEKEGLLRRPIVPPECQHNAHMYYILLPPGINRELLIRMLRKEGVMTVFHYVPLHSSPGGLKFGRVSGSMKNTDGYSKRLLRLPLWTGLQETEQKKIMSLLKYTIRKVINVTPKVPTSVIRGVN